MLLTRFADVTSCYQGLQIVVLPDEAWVEPFETALQAATTATVYSLYRDDFGHEKRFKLKQWQQETTAYLLVTARVLLGLTSSNNVDIKQLFDQPIGCIVIEAGFASYNLQASRYYSDYQKLFNSPWYQQLPQGTVQLLSLLPKVFTQEKTPVLQHVKSLTRPEEQMTAEQVMLSAPWCLSTAHKLSRFKQWLQQTTPAEVIMYAPHAIAPALQHQLDKLAAEYSTEIMFVTPQTFSTLFLKTSIPLVFWQLPTQPMLLALPVLYLQLAGLLPAELLVLHCADDTQQALRKATKVVKKQFALLKASCFMQRGVPLGAVLQQTVKTSWWQQLLAQWVW